jgi:hypothetical protein
MPRMSLELSTESAGAVRGLRPSRSARLVLCVGLVLGFGDWACGALGIVSPVRMLWPLLAVASIALMLTLLTGWLGLAAVRKRSVRVLGVDLLVLALSMALALFGPSLTQGFAWRIRATPEADWLRLADDARELARAAAPAGVLPKRTDFYRNRRFLPELAQRHSFLDLRFNPPTKLFITEEVVALDWGGGMAGPLEVDIHTQPVAEELQSDALYTTRRIHPRVTLTWE